MRFNVESFGRRLKTQEALKDHLRHKHALHELSIEPQTARGAAALQRATPRLGIVATIAALGLDLAKPLRDLPQPLPGIVRPVDLQSGHDVVIAEPEHGTPVLNLATPGDFFGVKPGPHVRFDIATRRRSRSEPPVVDVRANRCVARYRAVPIEPGEDARRLIRRGQTAGDGFEIHECEAVVVGPAINVDPPHESAP